MSALKVYPDTHLPIADIVCPIFEPVRLHCNRIDDRMPALCQRHECILGLFDVRA